MISSGFGVLALFSLLSSMFGFDRRDANSRRTYGSDSPTSWFDPLR